MVTAKVGGPGGTGGTGAPHKREDMGLVFLRVPMPVEKVEKVEKVRLLPRILREDGKYIFQSHGVPGQLWETFFEEQAHENGESVSPNWSTFQLNR